MPFVTLNELGKKIFGRTFPDGKVRVQSWEFQTAMLGDQKDEVILVSWKALSEIQRGQLVHDTAQKFEADFYEVKKEIEKNGFPLRKCFTTGTVAEEPRFFM